MTTVRILVEVTTVLLEKIESIRAGKEAPLNKLQAIEFAENVVYEAKKKNDPVTTKE